MKTSCSIWFWLGARGAGLRGRIWYSVMAFLFVFTGCVWRTRQADRAFGPVFYRFHGQSPGDSVMYQTLHVPVLLEGGRQWSFSLGGAQRLALVPRREGVPALPTNRPPEGLFIHPQPDHWRFSPLYLRTPLREPPVFIRRSVLGAAGGAGFEERALSVGYSSITTTLPEEEALYEIEFDSGSPLEATAVVTPLTPPPAQPQPPGKKEKP